MWKINENNVDSRIQLSDERVNKCEPCSIEKWALTSQLLEPLNKKVGECNINLSTNCAEVEFMTKDIESDNFKNSALASEYIALKLRSKEPIINQVLRSELRSANSDFSVKTN